MGQSCRTPCSFISMYREVTWKWNKKSQKEIKIRDLKFERILGQKGSKVMQMTQKILGLGTLKERQVSDGHEVEKAGTKPLLLPR